MYYSRFSIECLEKARLVLSCVGMRVRTYPNQLYDVLDKETEEVIYASVDLDWLYFQAERIHWYRHLFSSFTI